MRVNNVTRDFSMGGVFHGAVELNGKEWSFGYCDDGSGVYACLPKLNPQYTYRESVPMGVTALTLPQVPSLPAWVPRPAAAPTSLSVYCPPRHQTHHPL